MTCLRTLRRALQHISCDILAIFALLLLSAGLLAAQATLAAGPLLLHQVRTIYIAPSSDDFVPLVKARLEKWNAIGVTFKPEEADAILACQTESTIVPAKVVVRRTIAEVTLVDRRSKRPIWSTRKSATFDTNKLADDIVEQLKKDFRKSASEY
jgi:hypothetical protein